MIIHIANGDPVIAIVLMSLSTFKTTALVASFQRISLSFSTEEAAQEFVEEAKSLGCSYSELESTNVAIMPDFGGSDHAAKALFRAVSAYKDSLIAISEFEVSPATEEDEHLLKDVKQYLQQYLGSDAVTTATLAK